LAIQPRTLEVLAGFGVTGELIAGGNRLTWVTWVSFGGMERADLG
jgi:hypothetical protein